MKYSHAFLYITLLLILCTGMLSAASRTFCDGYDDYYPYGFQPAYNWENIRKVYFGRYETGKLFHEELEKGAGTMYMICPWWIEDLYQHDSLVIQKSNCIGYVGYVIDVWTGKQSLVNEWNRARGGCLLDMPALKDKDFELVIFCRNGEAFDYFLRSEKALQNFYNRLLNKEYGALSRTHNGKIAQGINLYLPDFTFKEKKAFTQFLKSLSMIRKHYGENGTPYYPKDLLFSLTLSPEAFREKNFLSTLNQYVDFINFIHFDAYGLPVGEMEMINENTPTPFSTNFASQFYTLLEDRPHSITDTTFTGNIRYLSKANYKSNNWEVYFGIELFLICLFIGLIIAYNLSSSLFILCTRYNFLVVPSLITLSVEIIILFLFMVEAASRTMVLFKIENMPWYMLVVIPLIPLLILAAYGLLKILFGEKTRP